MLESTIRTILNANCFLQGTVEWVLKTAKDSQFAWKALVTVGNNYTSVTTWSALIPSSDYWNIVIYMGEVRKGELFLKSLYNTSPTLFS